MKCKSSRKHRPTQAMKNIVVPIDVSRISDWESFHKVFAETLGFPAFYGKNLDAWIDCMTSLDAPDDGLTTIHVPPGQVLVLHLKNIKKLAASCPEQYAAIIECSSFVNWRRIEVGEEPILALAFDE